MVPVGPPVVPSQGKDKTLCRWQHQAGWALWSAAQSASHMGRSQWSRPPTLRHACSDVKCKEDKYQMSSVNLWQNKQIKKGTLDTVTWCRSEVADKYKILNHPPPTHLSCRFHPLPDAEIAHDPGDEQTQGQVPVQRAHVVNAWGNPQSSSPAQTKKEVMHLFPLYITQVIYHEEENGPFENSLPELHDRRGDV